MGKKSKSKAKKKKQAKKADSDVDPPIPPLSEEEQADLPPLLDESPFLPIRDSMDLSSLGQALGVTVIEANQCIACNEKKSREAFSHNQWTMRNDFGPRCRACVQAGKFRVVDPERYWHGWPKDPLQVLWERGWIDSPRGQKPDETRYPPDRIGKMVLGMPDSKLLLENFEAAGHYGYGGINEGLCCMSGCIVDSNLKGCSRCKHARYCCAEHQALHYGHHQDQCISWSTKTASSP